MGFFDFLKKKDSSNMPVQQDLGNIPSDIPPIDAGWSTNDKDMGQNSASTDAAEFLGAQDISAKKTSIEGMSNMNFNLPPLDETPQQYNQEIGSQTSEMTQGMAENKPSEWLTAEDLDKLFLRDENWREPDWSTFDPYHEEKIDAPTDSDFRMPLSKKDKPINNADESDLKMAGYADESELPSFDESTEETIQPKQKKTERPVQLFIKGSSYMEVLSEMDSINAKIGETDPKIRMYDEMLKSQEVLEGPAKECMEIVYKKLMLIDRKIFT